MCYLQLLQPVGPRQTRLTATHMHKRTDVNRQIDGLTVRNTEASPGTHGWFKRQSDRYG